MATNKMTNDDLLIFSKSLKALQDIIENNPEKEVSLRYAC